MASGRRGGRGHAVLRCVGPILAILAWACVGGGAGPSEGEAGGGAGRHVRAPAKADSLQVRDDLGYRLVLSGRPRRVVSIAPSNTEILFAIGAGELVVGVTAHDDRPPEVRSLPRVGGYAGIDVERVVALDPDLVVASGLQADGIVPALRAAGLEVLVIEPRSLDAAIEWHQRLGRVTGSPAAEPVADELSRRARRVAARVATVGYRPRVYLEIGAELYTAGPGSVADDLIARAGGRNVAAAAGTSYPRLSPEVVLASDPEIIFLSNAPHGVDAAAVAARPGWESVSAVRHGRIVEVPPDLVNRPGPRLVEALELMARAIHPGLLDGAESR